MSATSQGVEGMRRRDFLLNSFVGVLAGSGVASGSLGWSGVRLKFGDSDTPVFPFRTEEHGWWGYIDAAGTVLISPESSHIIDRFSDFYAGLGAAHYDDGSTWMIDTQGSQQFQIYPDSDDWNYVLRDGLIPNRDRKSGRWGYVDRAGRWVIKPQFEFVFPFSQQRSVVTVGHLRGVIDLQAKWIIPPSLSWAIAYRNGLLCAERNKRFLYFDLDGRPVFGRDFEQASLFGNGFAVVRQENQYGLIDRGGRLVMPFEYASIWLGNESGDPIVVKGNGGLAVVNKEGGIIPLPTALRVEPFSCGRALVQDEPNGTSHFIGVDGSKLFGTSYRFAESFVLDRATVQRDAGGTHSWIDRDGNTIFSWRGSNVASFQETM